MHKYITARCWLLTLSFSFLSLPAICQFKLLWSQKIEGQTVNIIPGNITGISHVNGGYAILFNTSKYNDSRVVTYPTISYLDNNEKLWRGVLFEDSLWEHVTLVGASQLSDSVLQLFGNDYAKHNDTLPNPAPYEISVVMRNKALLINDYFSPQLSDVSGVQEMNVNSFCGDGNMNSYLSIVKKKSGEPDRAILYPIINSKIQSNAQFEDVNHVDVPFASDKEMVVVTQTPFDSSHRYYYQIRTLNNSLQVIRTYPDDTKETIIGRMGKHSVDRLVNLSYRPNYHVGFVTRQVLTESGENRIAWYAFNGQQETNTAMGGDNIVTVNGYPIPGNEEVIGDGDLSNGISSSNRMIVSVDRKGEFFSGDDLVLSVGDYMGIESSRQVIKASINSIMNSVKAWADGSNHLYIVANLTSSVTDNTPGLYIMKWEATDEAINRTLGKAATTYGWSSEPYYSQQHVPANDSHSFTLLGIDSSDANYALNSELKDKKIKLQTALSPVGNTYWFSGTVKIDRKEYVFTKVAVKREE